MTCIFKKGNCERFVSEPTEGLTCCHVISCEVHDPFLISPIRLIHWGGVGVDIVSGKGGGVYGFRAFKKYAYPTEKWAAENTALY